MKRRNSLLHFLPLLILITSPGHILQFKLPFTRTINISNNDENDATLLDSYASNNLIVSLSIGSPPQQLQLLLQTKRFGFWILNYDAKGISPNQIGFNYANSHSYQQITARQDYSTITIKEGGLSSETIMIDNKPITDTQFLQVREIDQFPICAGVIGLDIDQYVDAKIEKTNLIRQLKQKELISTYAFSIKYNNDNSGELYLGELPHLADPSSKDKTLQWEKTMKFIHSLGWGYSLDSVYSGPNNLQSKRNNAFFVLEYGMIAAPLVYFNQIKQFFDPYLKSRNCKEIQSANGNNFSFICDTSINLNNFEDLSFIKGKYTFILTKDDLFTKIKDKYLFLVSFRYEYKTNCEYDWEFGFPFFRKFQMVFDQDRKGIGFYVDAQIKEDKSSLGLWWIVIILGFLFTLALTYFIYLKLVKRTKLKQLSSIDFDYILSK